MSDLAKKVLAGDRVALSRAITLVESQVAEHQELAHKLLEIIQDQKIARRMTISGPPGVGKSTFIETLGLHLISQGRRVAVLAIDPTSSVSGGSILGDRTRMEELSKEEMAFIRPSPSGDHLGGVAAKTRECILLCEAAGYDDILVETVGVGQSEYEARHLSDMMILLAQAASGDDLQGIKRGIIEMADLIVVNKADGMTKQLAEQAKVHLQGALTLGIKNRVTSIVLCSSLKRTGFDEIAGQIDDYFTKYQSKLPESRNQQKVFWMKELYIDSIRRFWREDKNAKHWKQIEKLILSGKLSARNGASELINWLKNS